MKHFLYLTTILGLTLSMIVIISCNHSPEQISNSGNSTEQKIDYNYTHLGKSVNVYDEHDSLVGFLLKAYTDFCGSDCDVAVLFLKVNANKEITVTNILSLQSNSLGYDLFEKNKIVYRSTFLFKEGESHFGCHNFKIEKIKYVNGKFELKDEFITKEQYALDQGDAQGNCILFPGLDKILEINGY